MRPIITGMPLQEWSENVAAARPVEKTNNTEIAISEENYLFIATKDFARIPYFVYG